MFYSIYNFGHKLIHSVAQTNGSVVPKSGGVGEFRDEHQKGLVDFFRHCVV